MSRLAIIADVHGNLPALRAIVDAAGPDIDHWICAGDIAGHLPMVDEVVELLIALDARCVMGNHDRALLANLPIASSSAATRALQVQRRIIADRTRQWLANLPERLDLDVDGLPVTVIHGGPESYLSQRVREVSDAIATFARGRLLVMGHTHVPLFEITKDHAVVNPGAVGLPVTGDRRPHAVVFDTATRTATPLAVDYDESEAVARMASLGYDERYRNCLRDGRWTGFDVAPTRPLIIAGASIYGDVIAEMIALRADSRLVGFVDDRMTGSVDGVPVLGRLEQLSAIAYETGVTDVAVAIGDNALRRTVAQRVWTSGVRPARLIHPTAIVSPAAEIGLGCVVDAQAYIGPGSRLAEGVSIWPGAVLAHHVDVGAYASIKHRASIGGNSIVAEEAKVDFGSVWQSGSRIGEG